MESTTCRVWGLGIRVCLDLAPIMENKMKKTTATKKETTAIPSVFKALLCWLHSPRIGNSESFTPPN